MSSKTWLAPLICLVLLIPNGLILYLFGVSDQIIPGREETLSNAVIISFFVGFVAFAAIRRWKNGYLTGWTRFLTRQLGLLLVAVMLFYVMLGGFSLLFLFVWPLLLGFALIWISPKRDGASDAE